MPTVKTERSAFVAALVLLALSAPALAAGGGASLVVQRVETTKEKWPKMRAYALLTNAQGNPIVGIPKESFKVYENGGTNPIEVTKVDSLEAAQAGAAVAIVLQASGSMIPVLEEMKKASGGFLSTLGEKDQAAVIDYSDAPEVLSAFSADKSDAAGKLAKLQSPGHSALLYDGLEMALSLFTDTKGPGTALLPNARSIIVLADGRDNGSSADVAKVIGDANKKRIPIYAIGHSEIGDDHLPDMNSLASQTGGFYIAAAGAEDFAKAFNRIKDQIGKTYVIDFETDLPSDGKKHRIDVSVESEGAPAIKGTIEIFTPEISHWLKYLLITLVVLLLIGVGIAAYVYTRPAPAPPRTCPVCKRVQMPEWDVCMFCLKNAKAKLLVQKGLKKGKVYPLVGTVVQIGSAPTNAVQIMDPGVSGQHAMLKIDDTKFEVVDNNSKNGVLVNGRKTPRRFLANGDVITLGSAELKFESGIAASGDEDGDDAEG